jgi:hypothetical protein
MPPPYVNSMEWAHDGAAAQTAWIKVCYRDWLGQICLPLMLTQCNGHMVVQQHHLHGLRSAIDWLGQFASPLC